MKVKDTTYNITHIIGRGGCAKVFKAYEARNKAKALVIKNIDCQGLPKELMDGYHKEAELLQKLSACEDVIKMENW